ncbi:MAG: DUF1307 domain-containing protein [Lachnospiraceae bacterium]|nr:DUF1307 domain-containing protein [Lachnospiraceae bacterium]
MKKIVSVVMVLCMTLALAACGGKEQTVSYRSEQEQGGQKLVDTMTLEAKGDKIVKITESIEVDMSEFDEATQEQAAAIYDALVEQYAAVEGVECTGSAGTGTYTISITIDATGDAVEKLAEQDLLAIEGNGSKLSLKATGESLEAGGYTKVE